MAIDLLYDETTTVKHFDPEGVVPTAATVTLYKPGGGTGGTVSAVTLPTASTTISGGSSTREKLVVDSSTGFAVGDHIVASDDGIDMVAEIVRVDGSSLHLMAALSHEPSAGATVKKLDMTATISGLAEADIGPNWRIQWEITTPSNRRGSDVAHVVRWLWDQPIRAADVEQHVAYAFTSVQRPAGYYARIARLANDRVRQTIEATGKRPHLYGDAGLFHDSAMVWARYQLAREGLVPRGSNPGLYQEQLRAEFNDEMRSILASLAYYAADDDGAIDAREALGNWPIIKTSR